MRRAPKAADPDFRGHISREQIPELCGSCHADVNYMTRFKPVTRARTNWPSINSACTEYSLRRVTRTLRSVPIAMAHMRFVPVLILAHSCIP